MEMVGLAALDLQWNCDGNCLGLRGMSRAGGQIPGLAALDLQWKCDGNGWAGGIGFAMEMRWKWLGVKRGVSRGGPDPRAGGIGSALYLRLLRRARLYTAPHVSNEFKSPSSTDRIYQQANQFNQCQS